MSQARERLSGYFSDEVRYYCRICVSSVGRGHDVQRWVGPGAEANSWVANAVSECSSSDVGSAEIIVQPALTIDFGGAVARVGDGFLIEVVVGMPGGLLYDGRVDFRSHGRIAQLGPAWAALSDTPAVGEDLIGLVHQLDAGGELLEFGVARGELFALDLCPLDLAHGYGCIADGLVPDRLGCSDLSGASRRVDLPSLDLLGLLPKSCVVCASGARLAHLATYAGGVQAVVQYLDGGGPGARE